MKGAAWQSPVSEQGHRRQSSQGGAGPGAKQGPQPVGEQTAGALGQTLALAEVGVPKKGIPA